MSVVSGRFELTEVEYVQIASLLPVMKPQRGGRWRDHRQVINGILFRVRTGVPWRDVPSRYGPWKTLYKRFTRWQEDGTWARIEAALQADADAAGQLQWHGNADSTIVRAHQHAAGARKGLSSGDAARREGLGKSRGGWTTKIHTIGEGRGRNLASHLTPGQDSDTRQLVRLLDSVAVARPDGVGRPRKRLDSLAADKAYSSKANRAALRARRIPHDIPEKDDQKANRTRKGSRGGRPPTFRPTRYRDRNTIERLMNRRKQFRAVATRYDKLACRYRATVQIADIFIWLRAKPDRRNP
ncbi:IS5 family transposase [Phytohabitans rumicis]|uniref:IS5 family transposase n=1 Tax=Phytohabitans rumicis TaxID=1076125 RepID=UPI0035311076